MKKTLKMLCGILCLLSVLLITLSGCDLQNMFGGSVDVPTGDGVTPIYYGMLLFDSADVEIPEVNYIDGSSDKKNNGNTDNNGNHYGWYKDNDGVIKPIHDEQKPLYVSQNQDVYAYVGISNPGELQIVSFVINGQIFTSDMFDARSTNEVKIVKFNVGKVQGMIDYTISEIKYADGEETKNVIMLGNATAKVAVKGENPVTATVNQIELRDSGKEVFFDIAITDELGLIALSNGNVKVIVYRDGKDKKEAELTVGENKVTIKTLNKNKEHEYEIVAYYDDLSGEGPAYHTLVSRRPLQTSHAHIWGDWEITKKASCTDDGEETRTCVACGEEETHSILATGHKWSNACDTMCNVTGCDYTRATEHTYDNACDADCNICGETRVVLGHVFDNDCDTDCNACGYTRVTEHTYDNACDADCNVCGETRVVPGHVYDNDCDPDCNVCGEIRVTYHVYDDQYDATCNVCGFVREVECAHRNTITLPGKVADCINTGLTEGKKCADCGETLVEQTIIPATGVHNYKSEGTPSADYATVIVTYTCSCGDTYIETIVPTDFTITAENRAMVGYTGSVNEDLVIPTVFEDNGIWYRVVAIGDGAFIASRLLLNVTIPNTVTNIGSCAFNSCSALQSIIIPDSVTDLGDKQFDGCSSLISVTIGSGISRIKYYTFAGCSSLISVVIPNSITRIDEQVFYYCDALAYIYYEGSENEWNTIVLGQENNSLFNATRYYYSETQPTTEGNFWHYVDGVPTVWETYVRPDYSVGLEYISNGDGTCYVSGMGICTDTDVIIPEVSPNGDTVIGIGYDAFGWDDNLVSVVIPDTVTNIGFYAFNACPYLTSITIGRGITYIEWGAFPYCKALKNFTVVEGNTAYYVEGNCLIERSSKALIKGSADSTIPQDIEMIVHFSFASCENLTHITIPKSVTKIHYNAFDCCFDLASITFEGTVAEWNAIDKETGWDSSMSQYIVDCIDGTISKDGTVTYKSEVQMLYEAAMRLNHEESLEGVYTLTGIVTVVNNVYLEHYQNIDVTIMVDGYSFYCFHLRGDGVKELGIGDTITVTGSIYKYNYWVEFGRFCQLDSRIPNAGGDPDCAHNYIDGVVCSCGHIKETKDPEPDTVLTIQEANELGLSKQWRHPTHGRYYVIGVIESIINTNGKHGNMYIRDEEGNTLYLYSLFNADGSKRFDVMDNQPAVGDTITVYGALSQYEGEAQMINAFMVERIPCEE